MTILFIENKQPYRAILVMELTDGMECKAIGGTYHPDTKLYDGELRVRNIPYVHVEEGFVKKITEEIGFASLTNFKEFKEKINKIIPEEEYIPNPKYIKVVVDGEPLPDTREKLNSKPIIESPPTISAEVKTEITVEPEPTITKEAVKQAEVKDTAIKPAEVIVPQNQQVNNQNNIMEEIKEVGQNNKVNIPLQPPSHLTGKAKRKWIKNHRDKEQKEEMKPHMVNMKDYPDGAIIGTIISERLVVASDPDYLDADGKSLPILGANAAVAKYILESLTKHPVASRRITGAQIFLVEEIDEPVRDLNCVLISNGASYVQDWANHK